MAAKVKITSKCTITPSSPIPQPTLHRLSMLDQLMPPHYLPVILFYNSGSSSGAAAAELVPSLKRSLAQTIALFYPLAGRMSNNSRINCNGNGCLFVEATAASSVAELLAQSQPDIHFLGQLLPCTWADMGDEHPLVALQVTAFSCGGIALGVCINHKIADAHSLFSFLAAWADAANGRDARNIPNFDAATYFPPMKEPAASANTVISSEETHVTKRFVFEELSISVLGQNHGLSAATRFEVVSALIWHCFMRARNDPFRPSVAFASVNLRRRMPQIPENLFGNSACTVVAAAGDQDEISTASDIRMLLAKELREAIRKVDDRDFVRRYQEFEDFARGCRRLGGSEGEGSMVGDNFARAGDVYIFTSWLGFPYYDLDFGFGKPVWVGTKYFCRNVVILMVRGVDRGVEAWITLSEEEMDKFSCDEDIISYAMF